MYIHIYIYVYQYPYICIAISLLLLPSFSFSLPLSIKHRLSFSFTAALSCSRAYSRPRFLARMHSLCSCLLSLFCLSFFPCLYMNTHCWWICMRVMTRPYMCHDSFICVTWGIRVTRCMCVTCMCVTCMCVTCMCLTRDMNCSYGWYLACALIHTGESTVRTHSYAWHDPFIYVIWLVCMFDTTHSCMCYMTRAYLRHRSRMWVA